MRDETGYFLVSATVGAVFSVAITFLPYHIECKLGMRNWNTWVLAGQLVANAAMGAIQGALFGGGMVGKIVKLAGLAQKVGLSGTVLKALAALASGTKLFINMIIKKLTRKPRET